MPKILIVGDSPIRSLLAAALKREPLVIDTASDGVAALESNA